MAESRYNGGIYHFNRITEYDNSEAELILLSHKLYYLQNGENSVDQSNDELGFYNVKAAKALLLLHSFPFNYCSSNIKSFFNSSDAKNVGYEEVPYGMLALLGGLMYRRRVYEKHNIDIVKTGTEYISPGKDNTFLVKGKSGIGLGIIKTNNNNVKYIPYSSLINKDIDIYIENKLIDLFKSFVDSTANELSAMELKYQYTVEKKGKTEIVVSKFCKDDFDKFVLSMTNSKQDINKVLFGKEPFKLSNNGVDLHIKGFGQKYSIGLINTSSLYIYYREDDINLQMLMDKLYNHKCGVLTQMCQSNPNSEGVVDITAYKNIINGFSSTVTSMLKSYEKENENRQVDDIEASKNLADEDIKKGIYMYMKQFWDKWLCGVYNRTNKPDDIRPFSVEWFSKQFLFIDTFYNDVSTSLKLNCSILKELLETSINSESHSGVHVYSHLANVAERHHCNFFCYPDFIDFKKKDANGQGEAPEKILGDLFKPMPYNQLNEVEAENQFVIMRCSSAQINADNGQFTNDGFDIWSNDSSTDIAPSAFKNTGVSEIRIGYKVPSFGVSYSRQDNSIFKTIEVGMDTIQITEQAIKSLCYISELGNRNNRAVSFYGNDIYSVYSAYSYIVTITMMGDAQIQPLMYFQLMNVPMFRGTYMVIEVRHSIRSGDFVTTFRGMKLSRFEMPTNNAWFTITPEDSNVGTGGTGGADSCCGGEVNADGTPKV